MEKPGKEGLKMDVDLCPPSVFTDAVERNPGILSVLYHYVINKPSNYIGEDMNAYKSLNACPYLV